jgi:poly(A) polymerase
MKLHKHILKTLTENGHQAYLVGGYVRDTLLGRESKDIDIATSATPDQVAALFPDSEKIGAHFGVILVKGEDTSIEVATFRKDGVYENHRHPSSVSFTPSLEEDMKRRDFTINALAMEADGSVIDHGYGCVDLDDRLIRTVGDPLQRFEEDALRMLRAVRFACQLGFTIYPTTVWGIRRAAHLIEHVSAERVQQELSRILTSGKAAYGMRLLQKTRLLGYILPEVEQMIDCQQNPLHHPEGDALTHTIGLLVKLPKGCSLTLALAALLHDIGKPPTRGEKYEQPTFYGHEQVGADMTKIVLERLKYPTDVIETVTSHVRQHMTFRYVDDMRRSKLYRFLSQPNFNELLELHRLDAMSGPCNLEHYEFCKRVLAEVPPQVIKPERLITGKDLIDMGLTPGPKFREVLEKLETQQLEGEISTRDEAFDYLKALVAALVEA